MSTEVQWDERIVAILENAIREAQAVAVPSQDALNAVNDSLSLVTAAAEELRGEAEWLRNRVELAPGRHIHASLVDHAGE